MAGHVKYVKFFRDQSPTSYDCYGPVMCTTDIAVSPTVTDTE